MTYTLLCEPSGMCPVQAAIALEDGAIGYFRARGCCARLEIWPPGVAEWGERELWGLPHEDAEWSHVWEQWAWPWAGYLKRDEAVRLIDEGVALYAAHVGGAS